MPGGYRRKRMHDGHTRLRRRLRLRKKTKDLDQVSLKQAGKKFSENLLLIILTLFVFGFYLFLKIDTDLKKNADELLNQEVDLDKPGFAQNYCIHVSPYSSQSCDVINKIFSEHFSAQNISSMNEL